MLFQTSDVCCLLPIVYRVLFVAFWSRRGRGTKEKRQTRGQAENEGNATPRPANEHAHHQISLCTEVFFPSPHEHRPGGGRKQSGKPTQGARPHDEARRHRSPDATPGTAPNTGTTGNTHTGDPAPMRPSSDPAQHQPVPGLIVFGVDCCWGRFFFFLRPPRPK